MQSKNFRSFSKFEGQNEKLQVRNAYMYLPRNNWLDVQEKEWDELIRNNRKKKEKYRTPMPSKRDVVYC